MWRTDIDTNKQFKLQLCQNSEGRRYCSIRSEYEDQDEYCKIESEVIPMEIMHKRSRLELERFCEIELGGHGEWFTQSESESLRNYDLGNCEEIEWVTEQQPCFAPK